MRDYIKHVYTGNASRILSMLGIILLIISMLYLNVPQNVHADEGSKSYIFGTAEEYFTFNKDSRRQHSYRRGYPELCF